MSSVAPQTSQEPRIPSLRTIITNGDAQRLLLPDQHEQPLASRDPRVDQVSLQQHVVLGRERGSGLAGCAYNLVAEGQAIVYPIPRIWEGLIPTYRHALWGAMV